MTYREGGLFKIINKLGHIKLFNDKTHPDKKVTKTMKIWWADKHMIPQNNYFPVHKLSWFTILGRVEINRERGRGGRGLFREGAFIINYRPVRVQGG